MKKTLSFILSLVMVIGIITSVPVTVSAASESDLTFKLNDDGESYIVKSCNRSASGEIIIPELYNDLPVTNIGNAAFKQCINLTSIVIPDSVMTIADNAFHCCGSLVSIIVDDNSNYYSSVDGVLFNKNQTSLLQYPAARNESSYVIPNTVTRIVSGDITSGNYYCGGTFDDCENLTSITIPNSVKSIDEYAFLGCTNLQEVHITDIASWCNIDFKNNRANPLSFGCKLYVNGILETHFVIPNSVEIIGDYAFTGCTSISSLILGDNLKILGDDAFADCLNLSSITFGNQLSDIGDDTFASCISLKSVILPSSLRTIGDSAFSYCSNLSEVNISNGITSIGAFTFYNCENLTTITIPDSVTNIGCDAFSNTAYYNNADNWENDVLYIDKLLIKADCYAIEYGPYTIREGTKTIADDAFRNCDNLSSVAFPDSLINIGSGAFQDCDGLSSITLPASVTNLGIAPFYYCMLLRSIHVDENNPEYSSVDGVLFNKNKTTLIQYPPNKDDNSYTILKTVTRINEWAFSDSQITSITIPVSVKYIAKNAFYYTEIDTVFYNGTEEQWDSIHIDRTNNEFLSAKIIFNSSGSSETDEPEQPDETTITESNGTFTVAHKEKSQVFSYEYKDSYFENVATEYNHELATMSLCLALSTFQSKEQYITYGNAKGLLNKCGFEKFETFGSYKIDIDDADDVGCLISQKKIGNTILIAVAVRSGGYDMEWASNFTLGDIGDHQGFDGASNLVKDRIASYIEQYNISGDVKLWITGYSRGAASATQTAAKLNFTSIDGVNFTKDEIYAYGFATPAGAIKESDPTNTEKYGNIFNIINFHDLVPRVAPKEWGFGRYGKTYYLPFNESSWVSAQEIENDVKEWFENEGLEYKVDEFIPLYSDIPSVVLPISNDSLGVFSEKLIKDIAASITTRSLYTQELQNSLRAIWTKKPDITISLAFAELLDVLGRELIMKPQYIGTAIINNTKLIEAHSVFGAYYLGWMETIPSDKAFEYLNDGSTRQWLFNCPVDVYIYDTNYNLIAAIENDMPVEIEGSTFSYGVDENGQKYFYLPVDGEYNITVKAREDCETTCTVNEFTGGSFTESRVVTFTEIPMGKDEELTVSTGAYSEEDITDGVENGSSADYTIQRENDEVIEADVDVAGEEIEKYTYNVTVEYDENKGTIYGGGTFTIGQFCQVTAENKPGYRFSKWTVNGETVSTETTYRFAVKEDVTIVAEYVPCEHPDSAISDWILVANSTVYASGSKHKECTVCGEIMETVVLPQLKPATPKLTKVSRTASGVKIEWQKVEGADLYIVYRKTSKSGWSRLGVVEGTSFTDKTAKTGSTYYYTVKAQNEAGTSSYNKTGLKIKYVAAPKLTKITNESSGVRVYWSKVSGADGYYLYRRVAGSKTWTKVATIKKGSTTSYLDKKASAGKTYEYIIKCYDGSTPSASAAKAIKIERLTVPKLVSTSSSKTGITFKWGKVTGADGYYVYRKTGSGSWVKLTTVKGNTKVSYVDKSAKKGKTYTYTVKAYSGSYTSAYNTKGLKIKDKY